MENKSCPFCGSTNTSVEIVANDYKRVHAVCADCGACGPEVRRALMMPSVTASDRGNSYTEWDKRAVEQLSGGNHGH